MILSEILDQVDTLIPNSILVTTKVAWINQVQNQLYRDLSISDTISIFQTAAGQPIYTLPANCYADGIWKLTIGDVEYPFQRISSESFDPSEAAMFWASLNATDIMIFPVPTSAMPATLYYRPRPVQLGADLTVKPTLHEDFHELLVLGCAARVAKADPATVQLASVFDSDYENLTQKAVYRLSIGRKQKKVTAIREWT